MRYHLLAASLLVWLAFPGAASAAPNCKLTNDGQTYCNKGAPVSSFKRVPRSSKHKSYIFSKGCPADLGCGCHLANYFGFTGKLWRELWVARNWGHVGSPASKGCVGCVAVFSRGKRGGHVGIVKGYTEGGKPIVYSYANRRLGWTTSEYNLGRVIAYREVSKWTSMSSLP